MTSSFSVMIMNNNTIQIFFEGNKGNKSNRGFDKLIQATTSLTEDFFKMWLPLLPSIYILSNYPTRCKHRQFSLLLLIKIIQDNQSSCSSSSASTKS
jgi:hypothetical protein